MEQERLNSQSPFFHEQRHASLGDACHVAVTICGAGALGGNLAETLARMGFTRLRLIDRDRVETRNLSSQPYCRGEIGAPKARALANSLYRAVQARVEATVVDLTAANAGTLLAGGALVLDAFDNREGRAAVSAAANLLAVPCLHIGFSGDGLYGSGAWEPGYRVPSATTGDPCDYPLTRPFALTMAALAARAVVQFLAGGRQENFELTWGDLRISRQ
jgi:molybdopterin/thiamine biosynthesis adenylyltransferase